LLYPIHLMGEGPETPEDTPPIGAEIFLPSNSMPAARFEPSRREAPDAIVVDAPK
jgi:hypothetical protein